MDFAKNILSKFGWKEGDGLGKNNDGISAPLKTAYKFNKSGLGHNQADDLNNHWWEKVYNAAADNVDVNKNDAGDVSMDLRTGESVEITTKNYSINTKADTNFYTGNFLRTSTLVNSGQEIEVEDKDVVVFESIKSNPFKVVTDEDLLRACKGRTAHKGARHGLKLSGKLSRIEEQERELLAKMGIPYTAPVQNVIADEWTKVKKNRKTKENATTTSIDIDDPSKVKAEPEANNFDTILNLAEYSNKSKKKAKKQRKFDLELADALSKINTTETVQEVVAVATITNGDIKKKKKKCKNEILSSNEQQECEAEVGSGSEKHKKKKKKRIDSVCEDGKSEKSRKRHRDDTQEHIVSGADIEISNSNGIEPLPPSKRKRSSKDGDEVPEIKPKKSSKKRKDHIDPSTPLEAEHFKKATLEGRLESSNNEKAHRKDKKNRKKEHQIKRLSRQLEESARIK